MNIKKRFLIHIKFRINIHLSKDKIELFEEKGSTEINQYNENNADEHY